MLVIAALAALLQTGPPSIAFPDEGHPFALINDLHETVYEPDFRQQRAWEESELSKNGIREAHGSVSQHELYTDRHVLLNVPLFPSTETAGVTPRSPLWLRYVHDELGATNLAAIDERFELAVAPGNGPVAITVSGWPTYEKSQSSAGAGLLVTDRSRRNYAGLRVQHDALFFNQRTRLPARFTADPLRLAGEANLERGPFRLRASLDWGAESRLVFEAPEGSNGIREHRGYLRRDEVKLEWMPSPGVLVGVRQRYTGARDLRRYFPGYVDAEHALDDFEFLSSEHRGDVYADLIRDRVRVRAQAGAIVRRESASFAFAPGYAFARDEGLAGVHVYRLDVGGIPGFSLGLGYWGELAHASRAVDAAPAWRDQPWRSHAERGYVDKADFTIGYDWGGGRFHAEGLLSHEVTSGEFGGGSVKVGFVF